MNNKLHILIIAGGIFFLNACIPDATVNPDPEPVQTTDLGSWTLDGTTNNVEYSSRSDIGDFHLTAESAPPDPKTSSINRCDIYYDGGLPKTMDYAIVNSRDSFGTVSKYVFIEVSELLSGSLYRSMNEPTSKATFVLSDDGRITARVQDIKLVKYYGKGKDTVSFSCEITERKN
ncbi:MAG: hypothetical protein KDC07_09115 [Chitinophagaceae bacterium]|nr:hypothetical protein [Chitinophagaceae bacterium]MCB9047176.1 hypothetical protein [Chitinophagales bacterium]